MYVQVQGSRCHAMQLSQSAVPELLDSLHVLLLINVLSLPSQKAFTVATVIGHLVPRSQIGSQPKPSEYARKHLKSC